MGIDFQQQPLCSAGCSSTCQPKRRMFQCFLPSCFSPIFKQNQDCELSPNTFSKYSSAIWITQLTFFFFLRNKNSSKDRKASAYRMELNYSVAEGIRKGDSFPDKKLFARNSTTLLALLLTKENWILRKESIKNRIIIQ